MSKEKRRVPKLRFPGFTEDWEQRKLGDYLIQYTEITTQNNQYPVLTSSRKGLFFQTDYYDGNQIASKDNTGYNIVPYGYFTYRHMSDDEIFHFNINYIVDKGIVSTLYPVFTTKNLNSNYLQLQLNYGSEFRKYAVLLKQGGSRTYMYFNKLKDLKLTISTSIDEQEIIAKFFISFEKLITLHQRKLDNLKLKKKALLQKLFPKNGERYPELRFPGFTDTWEQRKLGECMNSFAYGLNAAAKEYDGMHKYIRITDIDDETHNFIQSNLTSPDIDFNMDVSDYKLNVGDIVFARTGASVGKTYLYNPNDGDLYYAGFLIRGKVKEDCDAGFIYQNTLTKDYDSFIKITSQRSGQPGVNSKEYATFRLNIPCKDEQEQISKVLNSLDELFTLHQRKLDHLKLQKKALLQQMFV